MTTAISLLLSCINSGDHVVEIGIGDRDEVAQQLIDRGIRVSAIDIRDCACDSRIRFIQRDITVPGSIQCDDVDLVYAQRLPEELHRPTLNLAKQHRAPLYFTTLGTEWPVIKTRSITTADGTWYCAEEADTDLSQPE